MEEDPDKPDESAEMQPSSPPKPPFIWLALLAVPIVFGLGNAALQSAKGPEVRSAAVAQMLETCEFPDWIGALVDTKALRSFRRPFRVLQPGAVTTMDHNPERINVEIDKKGIVLKAWCG